MYFVIHLSLTQWIFYLLNRMAHFSNWTELTMLISKSKSTCIRFTMRIWLFQWCSQRALFSFSLSICLLPESHIELEILKSTPGKILSSATTKSKFIRHRYELKKMIRKRIEKEQNQETVKYVLRYFSKFMHTLSELFN